MRTWDLLRKIRKLPLTIVLLIQIFDGLEVCILRSQFYHKYRDNFILISLTIYNLQSFSYSPNKSYFQYFH